MTAPTKTLLRNELGDFSSIVCFKAVITGVEDTLGPDGAAVVFIRAGKVRGHNLANDLGVAGSKVPIENLAEMLNSAIGKDGTCLTGVHSATQEGDKIIVNCFDTVCSSGELEGSDRQCTFTLGAVWGAVEAVMGEIYLGEQTSSVLRGGEFDRFEFTPL